MRRWWVIVASLVLILVLARAAGFASIGAVWRSVDPRGMAVVVACTCASLAVRWLTWRRLLEPSPPRASALVPPLVLGFVLANVAPAKTGEPAPALFVSRALGLPKSLTLSALTAERGMHLLALLATFVPATALAASDLLSLSNAARAAAVLLALALGLVPFLPAVLRRLAPLAARLPRGGAHLQTYLSALGHHLRSPDRVWPLLALSVVFWTLQYVSLAAILRAGGIPVNLAQAAAVAGAAILGGTLSLIPLGTQDGISAMVLGSFGVPLARGFALALLHTLLSLGCCAVLAVALAAFGAGRPRGDSAVP